MLNYTKTKIIATIGPTSFSADVISEMIKGGMDIARLNFSHGTLEEKAILIDTIRMVSEKMGKEIAILQDLGGPKIRLGILPEGGVVLQKGDRVNLSFAVDNYVGGVLPVTYKGFADVVQVGDKILLADGSLEFKVIDIRKEEVCCEVIFGGILTSRKGINLPTQTASIPSLTQKDEADLYFGIKHGVDIVALSFVRFADDIIKVKSIISDVGKELPVVAKIEKPQALDNIGEIVSVADALMVARGDLGVEIPLEEVPLAQKRIINLAINSAKPVITATQMLGSMVHNNRPTRAEAADVVNAILDGSDCVMLSEETAAGNHPIVSVKIMRQLATAAERAFPYLRKRELGVTPTVSEGMADSACRLAQDLSAKVIVTPTESGATARQVASFRPEQPILALSPRLETVRSLNLSFGVVSVFMPQITGEKELFSIASDYALQEGLARVGDTLIITAGIPWGKPGTTNVIKALRI